MEVLLASKYEQKICDVLCGRPSPKVPDYNEMPSLPLLFLPPKAHRSLDMEEFACLKWNQEVFIEILLASKCKQEYCDVLCWRSSQKVIEV